MAIIAFIVLWFKVVRLPVDVDDDDDSGAPVCHAAAIARGRRSLAFIDYAFEFIFMKRRAGVAEYVAGF